MLMRTEEEYEVWQKMDEERARETGGKDKKRLMQENEVNFRGLVSLHFLEFSFVYFLAI